MFGNIAPTTLGNMVGGALVALAYWYAFAEYLKAEAPGGFAARQKAPAYTLFCGTGRGGGSFRWEAVTLNLHRGWRETAVRSGKLGNEQ